MRAHTLVALLVMATSALAADLAPGVAFDTILHEDAAYWVCVVDPAHAQVDLHWKGNNGEALERFGALKAALEADGRTLLFAMNGGIYTSTFAPGGLHVERSTLIRSLNTKEGFGNFHLMPNGVFFIDENGPHVLTTQRYESARPTPRIATQSGPMLVIEGDIHPKFNAESTSMHVRNGVGVNADGRMVFAVSQIAVNLHAFATLFRDRLQCRNALYLDGTLSQCYVPGKVEKMATQRYVAMLSVSIPTTAQP